MQHFHTWSNETTMEEIIMCANLEGTLVESSKNREWQDIDKCEMLAFLRLVIQAELEKKWDVPIWELLPNECSNPIYSATMVLRRVDVIRRNR